MRASVQYRDIVQVKPRRTYLALVASSLQTILPTRYDDADTFYTVGFAGGISSRAKQQTPIFAVNIPVLEGSMNHCAPVTPSDTQDLPCGSMWLSFVNSGTDTLHVTFVGGEDVSGIIVPSSVYPMHVKRVWRTGTTVSNIFTYWT